MWKAMLRKIKQFLNIVEYFIFSKEKKTEKGNAVREEIRTIRNRNIERY